MRAAGIAPASTVWKTVVLLLNDTRRGAPEGLASRAIVESARVELASPGCKPGVLPLNYDPAGREGIEPSRLSFGGSAVAMTRPKSGNKGRKELIAPKSGQRPESPRVVGAVGFEPMYSSLHLPGASYGS